MCHASATLSSSDLHVALLLLPPSSLLLVTCTHSQHSTLTLLLPPSSASANAAVPSNFPVLCHGIHSIYHTTGTRTVSGTWLFQQVRLVLCYLMLSWLIAAKELVCWPTVLGHSPCSVLWDVLLYCWQLVIISRLDALLETKSCFVTRASSPAIRWGNQDMVYSSQLVMPASESMAACIRHLPDECIQ